MCFIFSLDTSEDSLKTETHNVNWPSLCGIIMLWSRGAVIVSTSPAATTCRWCMGVL